MGVAEDLPVARDDPGEQRAGGLEVVAGQAGHGQVVARVQGGQGAGAVAVAEVQSDPARWSMQVKVSR